MAKSHSLAEARAELPRLLREVERSDSAIEITRRGKPVAMLISIPAYHLLEQGRPSFRTTYDDWRKQFEGELQSSSERYFERLRDRSRGRRVRI